MILYNEVMYSISVLVYMGYLIVIHIKDFTYLQFALNMKKLSDKNRYYTLILTDKRYRSTMILHVN